MQRLKRVVERFAFAVLILGGISMMIAMFLGTGDVVGTQFFGWPIPGAKEMTESTMVLIVFGCLTYAQIRRGHIRVELVYTRVGSKAKAAMDALSDVAAMIFFGLLLWQAIGEAIHSWRIGEADLGLIRFPLYPARCILATGAAILIVQLLLDLFHDIQCIRGKATSVMPVEEIPDIQGVPDIPEVPVQQNGQ